MFITFYNHSMKYYNYTLISGSKCISVKLQKQRHHFYEFLVDLVITILLRRNLFSLLHSTCAKKPEKNCENCNHTYLNIVFKQLQKLQNYCVPSYSTM